MVKASNPIELKQVSDIPVHFCRLITTSVEKIDGDLADNKCTYTEQHGGVTLTIMSGQQQYDEHLAYGEDNRYRGPGDGSGQRSLASDGMSALKRLGQKFNAPSSGQSASQGYYDQQPGQDSQSYGYGTENRPPPGQGGQPQGYSSQNQPQGSQSYGYGGQSQTQGSQSYGYGGQNPPQGGQPQGYGSQNPPQGTQSYGYGGQSQTQGSQGQGGYGRPPSSSQKPDLVSKLFSGLQGTVQSIGTDVAGLLGTQYPSQQYGQYGSHGQPGQGHARTRFGSFASEKQGNDVKWYVDGAGYFYAVSKALEGARESIWILDWWLSPELYLRRPPSKNEQYRLDQMLQRAAQRGVRVNIIVYKEVTQALTLSSSHTKHALEALHPNIAVFRHPDHLPDGRTGESSLISSLEGLKLDAAGASKVGDDTLKAAYGLSPQDSTVLYWAHHEKLLIVDSNLVFMGGLDLCFGRWDLNQHPIADAHGSDLEKIVFPGQDYNNARIMDFEDVAQPFQNKLDRTRSSRMGWSDVSISLRGPVTQDLKYHFVSRWNFIFNEKYNRGDPRYTALSMTGRQQPGPPGQQYQGQTPQGQQPPVQGYGSSAPYHAQGPAPPPWQTSATTPAYDSTPNPSQYQQPSSQSDPYARPQQYAAAPAQFQQSPVSHPSPQPSRQGNSRPHTPVTPIAPGQYQQGPPPSNTAPYQAYQPPASQGQPQQQPHYPPPPPGAPPAVWSHPQQYGAPQPHDQGDLHYDPSAPSSASNVAELPSSQTVNPGYSQQGGFTPPPGQGTRGIDDFDGPEGDYSSERGSQRGKSSRMDRYKQDGQRLGDELGNFGSMIGGQIDNRFNKGQGSFFGGSSQQSRGSVSCQVVRSCTRWSNGTETEHSVQDAYIQTINAAQHFIYIENQFFITATGDRQHPVQNLIGKAIVDRILRAARNNEKFKLMVCMPSVPGFAGDLHDESSLGTRAIMEYQYNSINRGDNSIMQIIGRAGYNPMEYIRFYSLRNYDRINIDYNMRRVEEQSGVRYEDARKEHDDFVGAGYANQGEQTGVTPANPGMRYQQYQAAAQQSGLQSSSGRWDSVAECYMLNGTDIRNVQWNGPPEAEIDAFVSEELYIHTKVLIADDKIVICGSANLNDRSQLGTHDSEIALVIADSTPVDSRMAGVPWRASRFASSLRRQIFRKHLGLVAPQDPQRPDANFDIAGVPNAYDWGSPEDNVVSDPLSDGFQSLWNTRARSNTEAFRKVFHVVPDDNVHSWTDYREFYEFYFKDADLEAQGKDQQGGRQSRYEWGHVVRENFPGGIKEVKDCLAQLKGTIVEMPLTFLQCKSTLFAESQTC